MAVVGTLTVDLVAKTASFEGAMAKAPQTARVAAKGIQDSFSSIDLTEARGSIALLSDDIGLTLPRHLRSAIAELPGFSAALAAAFPVVAVIAAGVAITEFVEKLSKQREEVEKTKREMMDHVDTLGRHAMATELDTLKIQDQIAMMEGRPTRNRLQEALVAAKIAASDLFSQMEKTNAEAIKDLEKFSVGNFKTAFTGGSTDPQVKDATEKLKKLTDDTQKWRDAVASGNTDLAAQLKATINDEVVTLNIAVNNWKYATDALVQADIEAHKKLPRANEPDPRAAAESRQAIARQLQNYLGNLVENTQNLITNYEKKGEADRTAAADTEMQNRIALLDKQFASTKAVFEATSKAVIAEYENQAAEGKISAEVLTQFKDAELNKQFAAESKHLEQVKALEAGKPALVKATQQQIEALDAAHNAKLLENATALIKEEQRLMAEQTRGIMSDMEKRNAADLKSVNDRISFFEKTAAAAQRISVLQTQISDQDTVQAQKMAIASGQMTEQQAVQQSLAALEANKSAEMQQVIARLNTQFDLMQRLKAITNDGASGTDDQKAQYNKAVTDWQAMEEKKLEITKQFNQQINAARIQLANNEHSQWNKMFLDYSQIQKNISQTARQTFASMNNDLATFIVTGKADWRSLETSAVTDIVKIALQYAESKVFMAVADSSFMASALAMLGIQTAAHKLAMVSQAGASTGAAAADALASVPFPENIAASATVTTLGDAFTLDAGAAARGAVLPNRDMMIHTHPEEMILPQHIANFVVKAANNASGGGGSVQHYHRNVYAPTVQATDAEGLDRVLTKHGDVFKKHINRAIRRLNN